MRTLLIVALLCCSACSSAPEALPAAKPAPSSLAALRIHVRNATHRHASDAGEDRVTGYTMLVRSAIQLGLSRAGYVVVVDPDAPHDLLATEHTDYQSRTGSIGGVLMTSLRLSAKGGDVDQWSGAVSIDAEADIIVADAVRIVEALPASRRLRQFAEQLRRPGVPCAEPSMRIAEE